MAPSFLNVFKLDKRKLAVLFLALVTLIVFSFHAFMAEASLMGSFVNNGAGTANVQISAANIAVMDITVPNAWNGSPSVADTVIKPGSANFWQGDALNSIPALGSTSGVGYANGVGPAGYQSFDPVVRDLDADSVFTSAADFLIAGESMNPAAGTALYDVTADDQLCSNNIDGSLATRVWTSSDAGEDTIFCTNDDTVGVNLKNANSAADDILIGTGDNWAKSAMSITAFTNVYKENVAEKFTYSGSADVDVYSSGEVSQGNLLSDFDADCDNESGVVCKFTGMGTIAATSSILLDNGDAGGLSPNSVVDKQADQLTGIGIRNLGTAVNGTDLASVHLWIENGMFPGYQPLSDTDLGAMTVNSENSKEWRIGGLTQDIGASGQRLYIVANVSASPTNEATLNFSLPEYTDAGNDNAASADGDVGLFVASTNDGPTDAAVTNEFTQTIDSLIPTIISATTVDSDNNGKIDKVTVVYSDAVNDSDYNAVAVDGHTGLGTGTGTGTATLVYNVTESISTDTGATPGLTWAPENVADLSGNTPIDLTGAPTNAVDGANPVLLSAVKGTTSGKNRITLNYSENVTVSNGASSSVKGDTTTAGTVAGFGSFATTGDVTVESAKNTVAGSGTSTITIDLADQAGGYLNVGSTAEPSGVFTPVASTELVDAASLQVNTASAVTAAGNDSWDLVKPTIASVTLADASGNNGRIDNATIVFSENMNDSSFTNANGALGNGAGTFVSGTANDTTTVFSLTADTLDVNTAASAADFTYSGDTTKLSDLAGNLLNTDTAGTVINTDIVETDGANPIVVSVQKSISGVKNRTIITYSENVTVTNGASTSTNGNITTAGTIEGFGSFATPGNVTVADTKNTVSGNGTSVIYIDLASQAGAFLDTGSTTEPTGTFSPIATSAVVDAVSLQVNAAATASTTGDGSWDLTVPVISALTPATNAFINTVNSPATVGYTLSESIQSGSITITQTGGTVDLESPHICTLVGTGLEVGPQTIDFSNITNGCAVAQTLVDGAVYSFDFNGTDLAGNIATTVSTIGVTFDTTLPEISGVAPATSAYINNATTSSGVAYTLSEQILSGSITITQTGGTADAESPHICTLVGTGLTAGARTIDISDTTNGCAIAQTLVDGAVYSFDFNASDLAANAATTVSTTGVTFDTTVPVLSLVTPLTGAFINNTVSSVSYTLSEPLLNGTILATRVSGAVDAESPHTCTLVGTGLATGAHTIDFSDTTNGCSTMQSLENGAVYDMSFTGADLAANAAVGVSSTSVTYDTTLPTVLSAATKDNDGNGHIDQIEVVYSEVVNDANYDALAVAGYTGLGTGTGTGTATLKYNVTESALPDTNISPNITWTAGNIADQSTNILNLSGVPAVAIDGAGPAIMSAKSTSSTVVQVTFSEPINDLSVVAADFTFDVIDVNGDGPAEFFSTATFGNDNILLLRLKTGGVIAKGESTATVRFSSSGLVSDTADPVAFNTQIATVVIADTITAPVPVSGGGGSGGSGGGGSSYVNTNTNTTTNGNSNGNTNSSNGNANSNVIFNTNQNVYVDQNVRFQSNEIIPQTVIKDSETGISLEIPRGTQIITPIGSLLTDMTIYSPQVIPETKLPNLVPEGETFVTGVDIPTSQPLTLSGTLLSTISVPIENGKRDLQELKGYYFDTRTNQYLPTANEGIVTRSSDGLLLLFKTDHLTKFIITSKNSAASTGSGFFIDTDAHWAFDAIEKLHTECNVDGYTDESGKILNIFKPGNDISRAELITMLVKCKYGVQTTSSGSTFSDVPADHWANSYINKAYTLGIVEGSTSVDGKKVFLPSENANRAEALKMILMTFKSKEEITAVTGSASTCTDVSADAWYKIYIDYAVAKGIITGYKDTDGKPTGLCKPTGNITRAESAAVVVRTK